MTEETMEFYDRKFQELAEELKGAPNNYVKGQIRIQASELYDEARTLDRDFMHFLSIEADDAMLELGLAKWVRGDMSDDYADFIYCGDERWMHTPAVEVDKDGVIVTEKVKLTEQPSLQGSNGEKAAGPSFMERSHFLNQSIHCTMQLVITHGVPAGVKRLAKAEMIALLNSLGKLRQEILS